MTAKPDQSTIAAGGRLTLSAEVYDPDGDQLTLRWSAPSGTFNNPTGARSYWTAPAAPGALTMTFTADDSRGGVTSATFTITVVGP